MAKVFIFLLFLLFFIMRLVESVLEKSFSVALIFEIAICLTADLSQLQQLAHCMGQLAAVSCGSRWRAVVFRVVTDVGATGETDHHPEE